MFKSALSLSLAALLATTAPVLAQDTAANETPPAATEGETPETLSMGTEVQDGPQLGQPYITDEFGDWVKRCVKSNADVDPCQMYQLLRDADNNPVVEVSIFKLENAGQAVAGAAIVAPLETLLTQNLTMGVDGGRAKVYPFTFCTVQGCVSRVGFNAQDIANFKAGNAAKITIVPAGTPDEKLVVDMSLAGFTAAFDAISPNGQR